MSIGRTRNSLCARGIAATALLCLTASCSWFAPDKGRVHVTVIEDGNIRLNPVGTDLTHAAALMRGAVTMGLVGLDEQGRIVPALAARWIVTDDGLSYIFRLRDWQWSDGEEMTAAQIAELLRQRLSELRDTRLDSGIDGIGEVVSMTGRVIEIRLNSPRPNLLQYLAQPEFALFRAGHGTGLLHDPEEDGQVRLVPLDFVRERLDEDLREEELELTLRADPAAVAVARFDAAATSVVLNGKFHHLPLVEAAGVGGNLQLDPVAGLFGLLFVKADGFWSLPDNRRYLSMAIDRPALLTSYNITAWQAREKIVPEALDVEGIEARPEWASLNIGERREVVARNVVSWQSTDGPIAPLRLMLPDGPGADILFLRVRSDLRRVGLDAVRVTDWREADVVLIDRIADYDSAKWFLEQLTCDRTPVCSTEADDLIAQAGDTRNATESARLFAEAEVALVNNFSFIPLAVPVRWSLIRSGQQGFAVNPRGWHPLTPLIGVTIS